MQTTYIGMDLHATTSVIEGQDQNGHQRGQREVSSSSEKLQAAISRIPGTPKKLVFEHNSHV